MWDYYLGGSENSEADRDAARLILGVASDVPLAALENREFLKHAVTSWLQKLASLSSSTSGPACPPKATSISSSGSMTRTHIAYVDNDPVVVERAYLADTPGVALIAGDLRDPASVLGHPELREIIDFSRPAALYMTWYFISSGTKMTRTAAPRNSVTPCAREAIW